LLMLEQLVQGLLPELFFFMYDNHKTKRSLFSRVFLNHAIQLID
jgi:hypothetical protein